LPGAIIFLWFLLLNQWEKLRRIYLISGIAIVLIIALPWHLLVASHHPEWFHFYIIHEHFQRYLSDVSLSTQPFWFFFAALLVGLLILPRLVPEYLVDIGLVFIYGLCGLSLMVLAGYTGLVSLGHAAFLGIGAYAPVYFPPNPGLPAPIERGHPVVGGGVQHGRTRGPNAARVPPLPPFSRLAEPNSGPGSDGKAVGALGSVVRSATAYGLSSRLIDLDGASIPTSCEYSEAEKSALPSPNAGGTRVRYPISFFHLTLRRAGTPQTRQVPGWNRIDLNGIAAPLTQPRRSAAGATRHPGYSAQL